MSLLLSEWHHPSPGRLTKSQESLLFLFPFLPLLHPRRPILWFCWFCLQSTAQIHPVLCLSHHRPSPGSHHCLPGWLQYLPSCSPCSLPHLFITHPSHSSLSDPSGSKSGHITPQLKTFTDFSIIFRIKSKVFALA